MCNKEYFGNSWELAYRYGLGELYGSGNGSTVRLVAQYQEDDSGNLTRIELYRVE